MIRPLLALVVAVACTSATTSPAASLRATPSATPQPSPTPVAMNVDEMMGGTFSPATVFALSGGEVAAVQLQNHFVPFRIAVAAPAAVVPGADGLRLYVADASSRLRAFDLTSGEEVGRATLPGRIVGARALAQDRPDRLLALLRVAGGVEVLEIDARTLEVRRALARAQCGDRLLASASRISVVCDAAGTATLDTLVGQKAQLAVSGGPIVAAAMLVDGTLVLGTGSGALVRVPSGKMEALPGPSLAAGSLGADGIAAADQGRFVALATSAEGWSASVYDAAGALASGPFPVRARAGAVLALWPFAYFGTSGGLWHVDLRSGLTEQMQPLEGAVPLAVSGR